MSERTPLNSPGDTFTVRVNGESFKVSVELWDSLWKVLGTPLNVHRKRAYKEQMRRHCTMLFVILPAMCNLALGLLLLLVKQLHSQPINVPFLGWLLLFFGALMFVAGIRLLEEK